MSSTFSTFVNLLCNLIGVGFLALPHFFAKIGFPAGLTLLAVAGISQGYAACAVSHSLASPLAAPSFSAIAEKLGPGNFKILMEATLATQMVANLVISAVVVADSIPEISRNFSALLVTAVACVFSFSPQLHQFRFSSILSLVAAFAIFLALAAVPADQLDFDEESKTNMEGSNFLNFSKTWGASLFAFSFAINVPRLTMEMPRKKRKHLKILFAAGITGAAIFYAAFAAVVLRLTPDPPVNVILAFGGKMKIFKICRILLVVTTIAKMPLSAHPAREILKNYIPLGSHAVTVLIFIVTFISFLFSGDLAKCVSLVGAVGALSASFLFPCFLLMQKSQREPPLLPSTMNFSELRILQFLSFFATVAALPGIFNL